jgi:hypothetical protein
MSTSLTSPKPKRVNKRKTYISETVTKPKGGGVDDELRNPGGPKPHAEPKIPAPPPPICHREAESRAAAFHRISRLRSPSPIQQKSQTRIRAQHEPTVPAAGVIREDIPSRTTGQGGGGTRRRRRGWVKARMRMQFL